MEIKGYHNGIYSTFVAIQKRFYFTDSVRNVHDMGKDDSEDAFVGFIGSVLICNYIVPNFDFVIAKGDYCDTCEVCPTS